MIWLFLMGVTEVTARPVALGILGTCGAAFAVALALAFNIRKFWWTHKFAIVLLLLSAFALLAGLHWKVVLLLARTGMPNSSTGNFSFVASLDLSAAAQALAPPPIPEGAIIHLALALIILLEASVAGYVVLYLLACAFSSCKPQSVRLVPLAEGALEAWGALCLALIIWSLAPVLTAHANDVHGTQPFGQLLTGGLRDLASVPSLQEQLQHEHALVRGSAHIATGMRQLWDLLLQLE